MVLLKVLQCVSESSRLGTLLYLLEVLCRTVDVLIAQEAYQGIYFEQALAS